MGKKRKLTLRVGGVVEGGLGSKTLAPHSQRPQVSKVKTYTLELVMWKPVPHTFFLLTTRLSRGMATPGDLGVIITYSITKVGIAPTLGRENPEDLHKIEMAQVL